MAPTYLLNEIRRQPDVLNSLYQRQEELLELLRPALARQGSSAIYAFGCGDSRVAAVSAETAFRRWAQVYFEALPSLEFLAYQVDNIQAADIAIPISMSGNVDRTVAGMRAAQARGATAVAITDSSTGQLAQGADVVFNLGIDEPASFLSSTVTYTATLLSLLLIARGVSAERKPVSDDGLLQTIQSARQVVESSEAIAEEITKSFHSAGTIYILGTGANLGTATHGAVKFAELADTLAIPQELEEFAHQQFWILRPEDLVIILAESGGPLELTRHFVETLSDYGTKVVVISQDETITRQATATIQLPPGENAYWSPLVMCIPLQFLAYYWSLAKGLNPNTRAHLREDERRFTTSRKLTRRKLIGTGL